VPKINVYLPDDLAEAVKEAGVPVSAVCQRALEQAVRRLTAIREVAGGDLEPGELAARLPQFTGRTQTVIALATEQARSDGSAELGTGHLLRGLLLEGASLGLQVLRSLEIEPEQLGQDLSDRGTAGRAGSGTADEAGSGTADGGSLRLSGPAAAALELTVAEATALGHSYVGTEHLLLGLVTEPAGTAGQILRGRGAEPRLTRRAVAAALAGFLHLRSEIATGTASGQDTAAALSLAVRQELAPLITRIERLEHLNP
jgi:ATP-dependent Clp protease ATP-binding subunit ClpA